MPDINQDSGATQSVGATLTMRFNIASSSSAEMRHAVKRYRENQPATLREALGAAQRAWEYFGLWLAEVVEMPQAERVKIRGSRWSFNLSGESARRFYVRRTGDDIASDAIRWNTLRETSDLRHMVEHYGQAVTQEEARRSISIRADLIDHVLDTLTALPDVDQVTVGKVRDSFAGVLPDDWR